jgi:hypothetical protein
MATPLTIPGLQRTLDQLPDGQTLSLARDQIVRLFGGDDVAEARLRHFATGHRCILTRADGCTVFEKRR